MSPLMKCSISPSYAPGSELSIRTSSCASRQAKSSSTICNLTISLLSKPIVSLLRDPRCARSSIYRSQAEPARLPSRRVYKRRGGYVPVMDDMLCDISAFRYHRIPPQVLAIMPDLPDSADDPRRERLCEHPLVAHFLGTPLHVLAQGSCGRKGDRIVRHVWNGERPFDSVRQTEFGLDVASPLFTLLTLSSSVSNERLIMCMYEMCGTFAVCKIAPQVKSALVQAYGSRWGDAQSGWENVKDVSENPTDLWKRPPLIELSELTEYVDKIRGSAALNRSHVPRNALRGWRHRRSRSRHRCCLALRGCAAAKGCALPITSRFA